MHASMHNTYLLLSTTAKLHFPHCQTALFRCCLLGRISSYTVHHNVSHDCKANLSNVTVARHFDLFLMLSLRAVRSLYHLLKNAIGRSSIFG